MLKGKSKVDHLGIKVELIGIIENLFDNVRAIIEQEVKPTFLIVSEDKEWKKTFTDMIEESAAHAKKEVQIVVLDYSNPQGYVNFESVLDMFALSRCKTILQGVKYSSYSILAALMGQGKLVNYSPALESNTECLIYTWNSAVEINGEYIENPEILSYMTKGIQDLSICPIK
jgi:hypothetical protein